MTKRNNSLFLLWRAVMWSGLTICASGLGRSQEIGPLPDGAISLKILRVRSIGDSPRLKVLVPLLPDVIKLSLISYPWLSVIAEGDSTRGWTETGCPALADSRTPSRPTSAYALDPTLYPVGEKLRLSLRVRQLPGCELVSIDGVAFNDVDVVHSIETLSKSVAQDLRKRTLFLAHKKLADVAVLTPFRNNSERGQFEQLASWIPNLLLAQLATAKLESVELHSVTAPAEAPDALIAGSYRTSSNSIYLETKFIEHGKVTLTIGMNAPGSDTVRAQERLASQLMEVIRARISPDGQWRPEPLLDSSATTDELIGQANVYRDKGQTDQAVFMYRKALEVAAGRSDVRMSLAALYVARKNWDNADAEYRELLLANPGNWEAQQGLARLAYLRGDYKQAVEEFRKALNLGRPDPRRRSEIFIAIGDSQLLLDDKSSRAAIDSYQAAISADPQYSAGYIRLARAWSDAGDSAKAIAVLADGLKHLDNSTEIRVELAEVYAKRGQADLDAQNYKVCLEDMRRMVEIRRVMTGLSAEVYSTFRECYHKLGMDQEAARFFRAQLEKEPSNAILMSGLLSYIYHDYLKDYRSALDMNLRAYNLSPKEDSVFAMNLLESYIATEQPDKALTLAADIQKQPQVPENTLVTKLFRTAAFLMEDKRADGLHELSELTGYYKSLPADFDRIWNFTGTKEFFQKTSRLTPKDKELMMKMTALLERPKKDSAETLVALEASAVEAR